MALAVSTILLGTVVSLILSGSELFAYSVAKTRSLMQLESASRLLRDEIGRAGYIGCARLSRQFPLVNHTAYTLTADNAIVLADNFLQIRRASIPAVMLYQLNQTEKTLLVEKGIRFQAHDIIVVSDCRHAEITEIERVSQTHAGQRLYLTTTMESGFANGAEVARLIISQTGIKRMANHSNVLYMSDLHGNDAVLATNIIDFKVSRLSAKLIEIQLRLSDEHSHKYINQSIYATLSA